MKNMKKILALLVAVMMMAAMVPAMAATADVNMPIKVEVSGIKAGNTLNLYKIVNFKLDPDTNDIEYVLATGLPEAYDTIEELGAIASDGYVFTAGSAAKACADTLANLIALGTVSPLATVQQSAVAGDKATVAALPAGWYVATVSGTNDTSIIYQNMIVNAMPVVDAEQNTYKANSNASFEVKHTTEEIVKEVGNPLGETTDDYSIGASIPYQIRTNIPNYPTPSKVAKFVITDTPNKLTDTVSTVKVTVTGDSETGTAAGSIAGKFTVAQAGDGFTVTFEKDYILDHPGAAVTVDYEAVVKEEARTTIALDGETADNTAKITFNPNPNENKEVEPEDETKDYTYGVNVYKYDGSDETNKPKLTGAKFILYEADGTTIAGAETEVDTNGYVSWKGLGAGTYKLVETQAPAGYRLDSTPRTITLSETTNGDDRQTATATETYFHQEDVPNQPGSTLPSTGGIGTTLFYVGGGILILAAVILLVTKRRMNAND